MVDVQCIMQSLTGVAEHFHTEIITTSPKVKITGATHIEFDEHHALDIAKEIVPSRHATITPIAVRRASPKACAKALVPGFSHEYLDYMLGGVVPAVLPAAERCHRLGPYPRRGGRRGLQQPGHDARQDAYGCHHGAAEERRPGRQHRLRRDRRRQIWLPERLDGSRPGEGWPRPA